MLEASLACPAFSWRPVLRRPPLAWLLWWQSQALAAAAANLCARATKPRVPIGLRPLRQALLHRAATGRPFSVLKYAMTADGKIATAAGHSAWVSSPASRQLVFETRARSDAVVVGGNTARLVVDIAVILPVKTPWFMLSVCATCMLPCMEADDMEVAPHGSHGLAGKP